MGRTRHARLPGAPWSARSAWHASRPSERSFSGGSPVPPCWPSQEVYGRWLPSASIAWCGGARRSTHSGHTPVSLPAWLGDELDVWPAVHTTSSFRVAHWARLAPPRPKPVSTARSASYGLQVERPGSGQPHRHVHTPRGRAARAAGERTGELHASG